MPQLNFHDFPPQLVWLGITFVALYILMAWVALPRVEQVLQLRADRIKDDLDRATALKSETDQIIAAYEKARADARAQAAAVSRETAAALAQQAAARQGQLGTELGARIKSAEANIAAARDRAMGDIRGVAADIAVDAVKRLVDLPISPADAQAAVVAALKERA